MNTILIVFIILLVINDIHIATVLIFGIFAHCDITNPPPIANKKQAATHCCGLLETQKGR